MNGKILGLTAVGLMACLDSAAQASIVDGTFSGTVYAVSDPDNALGLSSLIGLPITGTFNFNGRDLPLTAGGAGTCCSDFIANFPTHPVIISDSVGGNTYTISGTGVSALHTSSGAVSTYFNLSAQNVNGETVLPGGNFTGEIIFGLTKFGDTPFLLNGNRAGSTSFTFSAPASSEQGVGEDIFIDPVTGRATGAAIEFSITSASASRVPKRMRAPEIDPASAASGLTLLLGAIAVMRGRKVRI
jgi:hypothetical protein